MTQSLEQFREQVLQDPSLSEQFKTVSNSDEFAALAVQLGQRLGYSFTAEDVKAAIAQYSPSGSFELSDAQLETVAGGDTNTYVCGTDYQTNANPCN